MGGQECFLVVCRRFQGGCVCGPGFLWCSVWARSQVQASFAEDVALGVDDVVEDFFRGPSLAGAWVLPMVGVEVRDSLGEGVDVAEELRDPGVHER